MTDTTTAEASNEPKKARRTASFYQNKPGNPYSKSAAKRESVMALGSIEHLQQYFAQTGLATKPKSHQVNPKMLVPALGPSVVPTLAISPSPSLTIVLPPSPERPTTKRSDLPKHERNLEVDPEALRPAVIAILEKVEQDWCLDSPSATLNSPPKSQGPALLTAANVKTVERDTMDVLPVLQNTTKAIRSVRNYMMTLPDFGSQTLAVDNDKDHSGSPLRRREPSRIRKASKGPETTVPDPFKLIRRAALEVLDVLRRMEESSRIPLSDDAYDGLSVTSGQGDVSLQISDEFLSFPSRATSPMARSSSPDRLFSDDEDGNESMTSISFSHGPPKTTLMHIPSASKTVHVWEGSDDEDNSPLEPESAKKDVWDERLVLAGGWLYKPVQLSTLQSQRAVISNYLDLVDNLLFNDSQRSLQAVSPATELASHPLLRNGSSSSGSKKPPEGSRRHWSKFKVASSKFRKVSASVSVSDDGLPLSSAGSSESLPFSSSRTGLSKTMQDLSLIVAEPEAMDSQSTRKGIQEVDEDLDEEYTDEELQVWAQRTFLPDSPFDRIHALIVSHLPENMINKLPLPSSDLAGFLGRLSDGQVLCLSYNTVVRKSTKPFGFIATSSVHDIIGLEEKEQKEAQNGKEPKAKSSWTFRRTENLRLWSAALKLRYLIDMTVPGHTTSTKSKSILFVGPPVLFDAKKVAKRDDDWETHLKNALTAWHTAVIDETRRRIQR